MKNVTKMLMLLAVVFGLAIGQAEAALYECEDVIQNPSVLAASLSQTDNQYTSYGWSHCSGNTLVIYTGETPTETNVPHLRITGLNAGQTYQLNAAIAYPCSSTNASNQASLRLYYSYTSAADAVGGSALSLAWSDMTSYTSDYGHFDMTDVSADVNGNINIYLGGKACLVTEYSGWDYVDVTPEPATMVLLGLGGVGLLIRRRRRA